MLTESNRINLLAWERFHADEVPFAPKENLVSILRKYDPGLIEFAFGEFGVKLNAFMKEIDDSHPDLGSLFDGAFQSNSLFSHSVREILELATYAKEKGLTRAAPDVFQTYIKKVAKGIAKRIDAPTKNLLHIRFASAYYLNSARSQKKLTPVDLRGVWKKGNEAWEINPNSFLEYVRYNKVCEEQIQAVVKKAERFRELGCKELCSEMLRDLDMFIAKQETYYGFNRITMTNAAIILAKQHQYQFRYDAFSKGPSYIFVPATYFGKFVDQNTYKNLLTGENVCPTHMDEKYFYHPRAYPLSHGGGLFQESSARMKGVIQVLDNFPAAGNKPIFDTYWILVPGIENQEYDYKMLFFNLATPVLLGEKDGKCFFICYWT
jgi:hypothetical protein